MRNKIIIVAGPTCSGKSSLAVMIAKLINSEVISADSMQIYKGMDIGTAKITESEMSGVKHHMLDVVNPDEEYSVSEYSKSALEIIDNLHKENKIPIICGGTGLYIDSLLYPLTFVVDKDPNIRAELENELKEYGPEYVHAKLKDIDPKEAEKVHFNNTKRVIRALEIFRLTGKTKSELDEKERPLRFDTLLLVLNPDRDVLYGRINSRVDEMFKLGLENEISALLEQGYTFDLQSMQAIGYKEFKPYLSKEINLDELKELLKKNTRNYAKRQVTWFKRYDFANFCSLDDINNITNKINEFVKE